MKTGDLVRYIYNSSLINLDESDEVKEMIGIVIQKGMVICLIFINGAPRWVSNIHLELIKDD